MLSTHIGLKGQIQVSVVEKGKVVRQYPLQSNLILNQGLDYIATTRLAECFTYAAAGTGTTPTEVDGGATTATIVTGTVTISDVGYLAGDSTDVGKSLKMTGSGNVYVITGAISTTQCGVSPASSEGPGAFYIYNTNQTGLTSESTGGGGASKRTSTYLTGAPNCQTVTSGAVTRFTRTFDFAAEIGSITYNEIGFAKTSTVGSNLFSRIKLASGVALTVGQQLRVQYSVSATVSPVTPQTYATSPILNWATATGTLQHIAVPFGYVVTDGSVSTAQNAVDGLWYVGIEPNAAGLGIAISTNSGAHSAYGTLQGSVDTSTVRATSLSVYVAGSYTIDHYATFPVGSANGTAWRSYFNYLFSATYITGTRFLFDSAQTKLSTHTLTLGFRWTWNRTL